MAVILTCLLNCSVRLATNVNDYKNVEKETSDFGLIIEAVEM